MSKTSRQVQWVVVQYPGTDSQEAIAWFDKYEQAVRYVAVNADDNYPLDVMKVDAELNITTEY